MSETQDGLIDQVAYLMRSACDKFIMPYHENLKDDEVATKTSDTDFVTIADREAEFWLIPELSKLLDDVLVVGEESISDDPSLVKKIGKNLCFVIDPIDGTRNFVHGSPHFCSMVSLIDKGEPLIAWVLRPLEQDIIVAVADEGNYYTSYDDDGHFDDWQPLIRQSERVALQNLVGTGGLVGLSGQQREAVRAQLRALPHRQLIGSAGCEAVMMALGEHDFLMHARTTAWDHTPVDLLARGAGMVSASLPTGYSYSPLSAEALLVAPTEDSWFQLANHIWHEPVAKPS